MNFSTIAAISTPPGKGGVALIRISGSLSFEIAEKVFSPLGKKPLSEFPPRTQIYGHILSFEKENVLDDGLLCYFPAPHSFTGENVVEIACHGGEVISGMILSEILLAGAEMAKPGEFSRRAFMNGKLTLTAAEGVADLLDAKTEEAALLSSKAVRGKLSETVSALSEEILAVASSLWANLDYPEEDLGSLSREEMLFALENIAGKLKKLLATFDTGRAIGSGIFSAIVGKPNVGKSTFFNRLLGEDRAIVTAIPGTTRDVIECPVKAGRVLLNLFDTAGVREETGDAVEEIGIERALSTAKQAELIFALFDLSRPLEQEDDLILDLLKEREKDAKIIPVFTKGDLEQKLDVSALSHLGEGLAISQGKEFDFSAFIRRIEAYFISDESALREGNILANFRQKTGVEKTLNLVMEAKDNIASGENDIASLTLESALAALLEMDGKSAGEKILDEVFSRFCVGK